METTRLVGTSYDLIQNLHLAALGNHPDISAALYDGNTNRSLGWAQENKHRCILEELGFKPGDSVIDIGSGLGAMLEFIEEQGGHAVGLTVSKKQADYCQKTSLDARLRDWRSVSFSGGFNHAVSLGAMEHFCSPYDYLEGRQSQVYSDFFEFCHSAVNGSGRLFLQTMLWGEAGKGLIEGVSDFFKAEDPLLPPQKGTDEDIMLTLLSLSSWWPPESKDQVVEAASPYFKLIKNSNGRLDYVQTFLRWYEKWEIASRSLGLKMNVALNYVVSKEFRRLYPIWQRSVRGCFFEKAFAAELLDHERMIFERIS